MPSLGMQEAGSSWQFDIFAFAQETPGNTLSMLAMHFFHQSGLVKHYQMYEQQLCKWVQRIESGYGNHPYHNRSVLQPVTLGANKYKGIRCRIVRLSTICTAQFVQILQIHENSGSGMEELNQYFTSGRACMRTGNCA